MSCLVGDQGRAGHRQGLVLCPTYMQGLWWCAGIQAAVVGPGIVAGAGIAGIVDAGIR